MGMALFADKKDYKELVNEKNAVMIDVRTPGEFKSGHVEGCINIPLSGSLDKEIASRYPDKDQILILCCASGSRSGSAKRMLSSSYECYNAGPWGNLKRQLA